MLVIVAQACTYTSVPEVADQSVLSTATVAIEEFVPDGSCPGDLSYEIETSASAATVVFDGGGSGPSVTIT